MQKARGVFKVTSLVMIAMLATAFGPNITQAASTPVSSEVLLPVVQDVGSDKQLWGYINQDGQEKIKPAYDWVEPFLADGTAVVEIFHGGDTLYGLIDRTGKYILQPEYSYINQWAPEIYFVQKADETKMVTGKGETLFQTDGSIGYLSDKLAAFQQHDLYGYLDEQGHVVIKPQYASATAFSEGKAIVTTLDKKYAVINQKGEVVQKLPFDSEQVTFYEFHDGLARFYNLSTQQYGFLDATGKVVIPAKFAEAESFGHELAIVETTMEANRAGLINAKGELVVAAQYTSVIDLQNGLWAVGKGDESLDYPPGGPQKYAIVNSKGQFITDFIYDSIGPFEGKYASVEQGMTTFFIDQSGKKVETLPTWKGTGYASIKGDVITANVDQRLQYVKQDGTKIWQEEYSRKLAPGITVTEAKLRPHRNYLAYYPVVHGLADKAVQQKINDQLQHKIEVPESDLTTNDYSYDFSVVMYQKDLLVIETDSYNYPYGAAHGMPGQEYKHINLRTGQSYQLKDLFLPNAAYMKKLNELIQAQIKDKGEEMGVFPEEVENFPGFTDEGHFYLQDGKLNLYFYPYEIGPYAAGFITFSIPLDSLSDIINTKGDFWKSLY